ncbi:MAG TPA: hypothetical protein VK422_07660 [Pyrinomonadaceae bacterium]|nr:hypothetical protein [Pyrinomonadaceae bacterium]
MRKFIVAVIALALCAPAALAQDKKPPTLHIVTEDGNRLPADLFYGETRVKPLRLRPGTNAPITIEDTDFFVQQQYVDFLSRFPDASGFAHWQNVIDECGANAQCREVNRINVSGAFFLAIEFQQTGYLVYRFHKAAFGNLPGAPVPVRRETFMPDTRAIANGVVVLAEGWEAKLEANKVAFAQAFVQRPEFTAGFPTTMTPAAFVDQLNTRAGGPLDAAERQSLINELSANNTTAGRASVLRKVAEDATLEAAEKNRAFVLMQYFGYLKRNPNEGRDTDWSGYNFWLGNLEKFGGNFVQAELVKAFIQSAEYNSRF